MKKSSLKLLSISILLLSMVYIFQSCSKASFVVPDNSETGVIIDKDYSYNGMFSFPRGTYLEVKDNKLEYRLPDGYKLITLMTSADDPQGRIGGGGSGSVECECTGRNAGGCYPFINTLNGEVGCIPNGQCDATCLVKSSDKAGFQIIDAQVVNLNAESKLIKTDNPILPWAKNFVFEDKDVSSKMNSFLNQFTNEIEREGFTSLKELPPGYLYIPADFLGGLVYVPVNTETTALGKEIGGTITYNCECLDADIADKACRLIGLNGYILCSSRVCNRCKLTWTN